MGNTVKKSLKELAYESPASQEGWEMWQMLEMVARIEPKIIVEIGVDGGGSLITWQQAFNPSVLVGIDSHVNENSLKEKLAAGLQCHILHADSQKDETKQALVTFLGGKEIDFLFIDGDHHYEAAKRDFELYMPIVRVGGMIGFHDTNNRGIEGVEVDKFLRELDEKMSYPTADFRSARMAPGTRIIIKE